MSASQGNDGVVPYQAAAGAPIVPPEACRGGATEMAKKLRKQRRQRGDGSRSESDAKADDEEAGGAGDASTSESEQPSRKRRKVNNDLGNDAKISINEEEAPANSASHREAGHSENTSKGSVDVVHNGKFGNNESSEKQSTHEEDANMEDDDEDEDESEFDENDLEDDDDDEETEGEGEDEDVDMNEDAAPTPTSSGSNSNSSGETSRIAGMSSSKPSTSSSSKFSDVTLPDTPAHKVIPQKVQNSNSRRSRRRNVSPDFEWESAIDNLHFKCVSNKDHPIAKRVEKDMIDRFGEDTAEVTWDYLRKTQLKCGFAVLQTMDPSNVEQSLSKLPPLASAVVDLSMIDGKPALRIALVQTANDKQGLGFGRVMVASLEEMARRLMSSHLDRPGWPLVLVCASVEEEGLGGVALTFWQHKSIGYQLCEESVPVPSDPPLVWTEERTDEFLMYSNNSKLMWKTIGKESEIELALAVHRHKKTIRSRDN